jgi:hypothetical protein
MSILMTSFHFHGYFAVLQIELQICIFIRSFKMCTCCEYLTCRFKENSSYDVNKKKYIEQGVSSLKRHS